MCLYVIIYINLPPQTPLWIFHGRLDQLCSLLAFVLLGPCQNLFSLWGVEGAADVVISIDEFCYYNNKQKRQDIKMHTSPLVISQGLHIYPYKQINFLYMFRKKEKERSLILISISDPKHARSAWCNGKEMRLRLQV